MNWLKRLFDFRELKDEPKPFLDHLEDLRVMLIKMAITLAAAMLLAFTFRSPLFAVVQRPLMAVDPQRANNLQSLGVVDSFSISIELSFYSGVIIAFPFLVFFLAEFVLPALTVNERKSIFPAAAFGLGLFLAGVTFAYFVVLPQTLLFFFKDAQSLGWAPTWTVREYYSFTTQFVIAFGLAFELPVVVLLLVKLDILDAAALKRIRMQAFVAIMIFAAVLTPTSDAITLLLMGVPMYVLFELCIFLAVLMQKREASAPLTASLEEPEAVQLENGGRIADLPEISDVDEESKREQ